jgi:hypothetical protein
MSFDLYLAAFDENTDPSELLATLPARGRVTYDRGALANALTAHFPELERCGNELTDSRHGLQITLFNNQISVTVAWNHLADADDALGDYLSLLTKMSGFGIWDPQVGKLFVAADSNLPPEGSLEDRELCPDGACIGLIGSDGKCKVCGLHAESTPRR